MFKPYRIYPLLGAALLLAPVGVSAKTEISWAQYMQGMHFMRYHGVYNGADAPDLACRGGGAFHSSRYYSGPNGYRKVPAPNPRRQGYEWKTPTAKKGRGISALTTGGGKKTIETLSESATGNFTTVMNGNLQLKVASLQIYAHPAKWNPRDDSACMVGATAGGDPDPGPLHGPDPQNRFYRLGPCQGAGHRGTAYEVWTPARTHVYCVDHQYMLYSFNLVNKGFWQKKAGPGSVLAKEYPKLAALATRMWSHPRQKQDVPWMYGAVGPSTFTALTRIGGVRVQVPPRWWNPHGPNCSKSGNDVICTY